jgi:hypothetical protein
LIRLRPWFTIARWRSGCIVQTPIAQCGFYIRRLRVIVYLFRIRLSSSVSGRTCRLIFVDLSLLIEPHIFLPSRLGRSPPLLEILRLITPNSLISATQRRLAVEREHEKFSADSKSVALDLTQRGIRPAVVASVTIGQLRILTTCCTLWAVLALHVRLVSSWDICAARARVQLWTGRII